MDNVKKKYEVSNYSRENSWYLVYTQARAESRAVLHLQQQNFETYCPHVLDQKRQRGMLNTVIAPMFPRYVFIRLNTAGSWAPIRSTPGVSRLVSFGTEPARVPQILIESLRDNEDESGYQLIEAECYKRGDSVRITSGPFEGVEAVFLAQRSSDRVTVLLNLVGKATQVKLPAENLETV